MDKVKDIEMAWDALDEVESLSKHSMENDLLPWKDLIRKTIEAGALTVILAANNHDEPRILAAAPFLKRSLNDLRAIWLLIQIGYTSQAASIAASLYENALTAAILADSEDLAREASSTKYSEIPWGAKKLAQLNAKRSLRICRKGKSYSKNEYEDAWTVQYFNYKWLCQIKHPTWQSVFHDLKSTLTERNKYVVFPAPFNKQEDLHLKFAILGGAVSQTLEAVKSYFLSLDCIEGVKGYEEFEEKVNIVHFGVIEQMKKYSDKKPPVTVIDRRFIKTDGSTLEEKNH